MASIATERENVEIRKDGVLVGRERTLDILTGSGLGLTVSDVPLQAKVEITVGHGVGVLPDAHHAQAHDNADHDITGTITTIAPGDVPGQGAGIGMGQRR